MNNTSQLCDILPFTPCQAFFLGQETKSNINSTHVYGYRLGGHVDELVVQQVWAEIVAAYPSLRTSLHVLSPGRAFQVIHEKATPVFRYFDIRHLSEVEQLKMVQEYQEQDSTTPFDWHTPPLLRIALHRLGDRESIMSVTIDHLIFDGWSLGLATRDFLQGCEALGKGEPWELLSGPSIAEYIHWYRGQNVAEAIRWFEVRMQGLHTQKLPFVECSQWPEKISAEDVHFLELTDEEIRQLEEGAQRLGVTLFALFQGAWSLVLAQCQKEDEAYFLSTTASRPAGVSGIQSLFGLLLGVLPYRFSCRDADRVKDWLDGIRAYQVEAVSYHFTPPDEILSIQKSMAPDTQTSCLVFQNMDTGTEAESVESNQIVVSPGGLVSRSDYPLVVGAQANPKLQISIMYDARIFSHDGVSSLAQLMRDIMLALPRDIDATLADVRTAANVQQGLKQVAASMPDERVSSLVK